MEEEESSSSSSSSILNLSEATEYVRQQLVSMGVDKVTEGELEAYTKDFLQLLKEKESSEEESESDEDATPPATPPVMPSSAVYKTILPYDDEGSITRNLTATSSPTPSLTASSDRHVAAIHDEPVLQVSVRNDGNQLIKRKVLRQTDSTHYNADVSDSSSVSCTSNTGNTSITSNKFQDNIRQPKSFIRPATGLPHYIKGTSMRKCDPVQRYHDYNESWKVMKPPGEKPRYGLRWHIREQLLLQDTPPVLPPPRQYCQTSNSYVVPTSKKRQGLRWEIRHQLAQTSN